MKRLFKRIHELLHRLHNYRYWRAKGIPMVRAWRKSDLTL
jgi:hypothetical protein